MAEFAFGTVETDQHPAFVEIGSLGCGSCVDQHRGGVDAVGFNTNAINTVAETGKHLAANLPTIKLGGWISGGGAG